MRQFAIKLFKVPYQQGYCTIYKDVFYVVRPNCFIVAHAKTGWHLLSFYKTKQFKNLSKQLKDKIRSQTYKALHKNGNELDENQKRALEFYKNILN